MSVSVPKFVCQDMRALGIGVEQRFVCAQVCSYTCICLKWVGKPVYAEGMCMMHRGQNLSECVCVCVCECVCVCVGQWKGGKSQTHITAKTWVQAPYSPSSLRL